MLPPKVSRTDRSWPRPPPKASTRFRRHLRYLPTADGVTLDSSVSPDYWELGPITLEDMKRRLDTFDFRVKFMLEEGSQLPGLQVSGALSPA